MSQKPNFGYITLKINECISLLEAGLMPEVVIRFFLSSPMNLRPYSNERAFFAPYNIGGTPTHFLSIQPLDWLTTWFVRRRYRYFTGCENN